MRKKPAPWPVLVIGFPAIVIIFLIGWALRQVGLEINRKAAILMDLEEIE